MRDAQITGTPAPRVAPDRTHFYVEILLVGRDLLRGQTRDSNGVELAAALAARGALIRRISMVDDRPQAITESLRVSLENSPNLILVIGGLGPADDDVTYGAVAEALGKPLTTSPLARRHVEEAYQRMARARRVNGSGMNLAREKGCLLPVGATLLPNAKGIVPGALMKLPGGTTVVCLPGRPSECRATWGAAEPELSEVLPRGAAVQRELEAPTADESELKDVLTLLRKEHPFVYISTLPAGSPRGNQKVLVTLETIGADEASATKTVDAAMHHLLRLAGGGG